jgi:preprotein translocase subunit YajC
LPNLNKARGNEYYLKAEDLAIEAQTIAQKVLGLNTEKIKVGTVGEETPEPLQEIEPIKTETVPTDETIDLKQDETKVSESPASVDESEVLPERQISIPEKVEPAEHPSNEKDEQIQVTDNKTEANKTDEVKPPASVKTKNTPDGDVEFPARVKKSEQSSSNLNVQENAAVDAKATNLSTPIQKGDTVRLPDGTTATVESTNGKSVEVKVAGKKRVVKVKQVERVEGEKENGTLAVKNESESPVLNEKAKESFEMTAEEYEKAVFDGQIDFPQLGSSGGTIQDAVKSFNNTDDVQNKEIARKEVLRHIEGRHKTNVIKALFKDGKTVPPEVLADYPDLAKQYAEKPPAESAKDVPPTSAPEKSIAKKVKDVSQAETKTTDTKAKPETSGKTYTLTVGEKYQMPNSDEVFEILPSGKYQNKNFYKIRHIATGEILNRPFKPSLIAQIKRVGDSQPIEKGQTESVKDVPATSAPEKVDNLFSESPRITSGRMVSTQRSRGFGEGTYKFQVPVQEYIDEHIQKGFTELRKADNSYVLANPRFQKNNLTLKFNNKSELDYIKHALNQNTTESAPDFQTGDEVLTKDGKPYEIVSISDDKANLYSLDTGDSVENVPLKSLRLGDTTSLQMVVPSRETLLAPNGNPSNLTPFQYAQVRTEKFKKWFGDWEKPLKLKKLVESAPIIIKGDEITNKTNHFEARKDAQKWALSNIRGRVINKDTGFNVIIGRDGVKEAAKFSRAMADLQIFAKLPALLESAVLIESHPSRHIPNEIFHYFVVGAKIGQEDFTVKLVVRQDINKQQLYYEHRATEIEKSALLSAIRLSKPDASSATDFSKVNDRRLRDILQEKPFSKVVDENGEPALAFHATTKDIATFDESRAGDASNGESAQLGFFFTDDPDVADIFSARDFDPSSEEFQTGANTLPVVLSIKNPKILTAEQFQNILSQNATKADFRTAKAQLQEKGFDGIIIEAEEYDGGELTEFHARTFVAFERNQIKSIFNNGEFSGRDEILQKLASSADTAALSALRAPGVDRTPFLEAMETSVKGDVVNLNPEASEILSYALDLANYTRDADNYTRRQASLGEFHADGQEVTNALDNLLKTSLNEERGFYAEDVKGIEKLKADITEATKENGTVIFLTYDDALAHERGHQLDYLAASPEGKKLINRIGDIEQFAAQKREDGKTDAVADVIDTAYNTHFKK